MAIRIMSLNCWGGELFDELMPYMEAKAAEVDVICLQEVHHCYGPVTDVSVRPKDPGDRSRPIRINLFEELVKRLDSEFDCYFSAQLYGCLHDLETTHLPVAYGNAMFIRKNLHVPVYGQNIISGGINQLNTQTEQDGSPASKSMQYACVIDAGKPILLAHGHGHWDRNGKGDTHFRFMQNRRVIKVLEEQRWKIFGKNDPKIVLMGDFNYTTEMAALWELVDSTVFSNSGGVHINGDAVTRTKHYPEHKPFRQAGHVIMSPTLEVQHFTIDLDAPSDHAAFILKTAA